MTTRVHTNVDAELEALYARGDTHQDLIEHLEHALENLRKRVGYLELQANFMPGEPGPIIRLTEERHPLKQPVDLYRTCPICSDRFVTGLVYIKHLSKHRDDIDVEIKAVWDGK